MGAELFCLLVQPKRGTIGVLFVFFGRNMFWRFLVYLVKGHRCEEPKRWGPRPPLRPAPLGSARLAGCDLGRCDASLGAGGEAAEAADAEDAEDPRAGRAGGEKGRRGRAMRRVKSCSLQALGFAQQLVPTFTVALFFFWGGFPN